MLSVVTVEHDQTLGEFVECRRTPQSCSPNMFSRVGTSIEGGSNDCSSTGRMMKCFTCGPRCQFQSCPTELQCIGVIVIVPQSLEHFGCLACNLHGEPSFVQFSWRNLKYTLEKVLCDFGAKVRLKASWDFISAVWRASEVVPEVPYQKGIVTAVVNGVATIECISASKIMFYALHEFPHHNIRVGTNVEFVSVCADDGEEVITRLDILTSEVQQISLEKYIGRVVSIPSGPNGCELGTLEYSADTRQLLVPFWKKDLAFTHTLLSGDFVQFRLRTDVSGDKNGRFAVDIHFLIEMSLFNENGRVQADVLSVYPDYAISICQGDKRPILFRKSELIRDIGLRPTMIVDVTTDKSTVYHSNRSNISCPALAAGDVASVRSSSADPPCESPQMCQLWHTSRKPITSEENASESCSSISSIENDLKHCDMALDGKEDSPTQHLYDPFGIKNIDWSSGALYSSNLLSENFTDKVTLCLSPQKALINKSLEKARSAWYAVAPTVGAK
ncbi:unnamed protein product [Soboliphyme baturini]|uniref:S1 motif domain-containing protein n=1 Tax=Soboliphyme baturini TaxID=241478 RepID=A0A183J204_9BILA|nr:unnamed protein product [Soboliphyme baturini]